MEAWTKLRPGKSSVGQNLFGDHEKVQSDKINLPTTNFRRPMIISRPAWCINRIMSCDYISIDLVFSSHHVFTHTGCTVCFIR